MNLLLLALGAVLLAAAAVDLLWTTLWVDGGAGPLTSHLMELTWMGLRRAAGENSRALSLAGPLILVLTLAAWIALLWGGWTLVFGSAETGLVDTIDSEPVSWVERFYFVGYAIFTLGNGDFAPVDGVWQVATALATASGMLFVTLSVTYVLSVLDAVKQKRSFASGVRGLGARSEEVLRTSWDGDDFRGLDLPLDRFSSELDTLTSNHKAYPVLHYFHSEQAERDPVVSISVLDGVLTLLGSGVAERSSPSETSVANARSSVRSYLDTVGPLADSADRSPPPPDLGALREAGVPTVSDEAFAASVAEADDRRRRLLGLVESSEREWPSSESE